MEEIQNKKVYLTKMSKTFFDKAWFMSHIPEEIDTIIDFGCADGSFMEFLKNSCPSIRYYGIDNDPSFVRIAQGKGFVSSTSLEYLHDINPDTTCLVLNSVLHEVYSYDKVKEFWKQIEIFKPKYIAIRDMMLNIKKDVDLTGVEYVFEKYYKNQFQDFKEYWFDEHDLGYTYKFFVHFMLKYLYDENWNREVKENYLSLTLSELIDCAWDNEYEIEFKNHYKLPYLVNRWKEDFHLAFEHEYTQNLKNLINNVDTHFKMLLKRS